ncbi:MAG: glycosyltransferase family 1 protein [Candidatus Gottesmanbacteria bacterium]|nr:glycosyltransferase family 1 protein [Candidatus Gottesmanbacteria bacterium]
MIIGVDAGALSVRDDRLKVGVYHVTLNLLRELGKIDKTNEYRLYTFLPISPVQMKEFGPRMKNVIVRPVIGWSMIQIPIELRRHPIDVFLGLSQMIPISSARNIGFVYDLGFLRYPGAYPGSLARLEMQTKQLVKRSDHIVAISKSTQTDIMGAYRIGKNRLTVDYPGIDQRFTSNGPKYKEKRPYILYVGALKRGKNIPFAIRAFKKFSDESKKPYDFLLVGGDYWADRTIPHIIEELGLWDRVKLAGFVTDGTLPSYYRGASALFLTSLWEGFCLPATEAMKSGCPIVYAKTGSLPEIVGDTGLVFAKGNETEAADALAKITGSAMLRKKLVNIGIQRSKQFTWRAFAQSVYRVITQS